MVARWRTLGSLTDERLYKTAQQLTAERPYCRFDPVRQLSNDMLSRSPTHTRPAAGFIEPCFPTLRQSVPSRPNGAIAGRPIQCSLWGIPEKLAILQPPAGRLAGATRILLRCPCRCSPSSWRSQSDSRPHRREYRRRLHRTSCRCRTTRSRSGAPDPRR
jgi:hypothetical protein